MFLDDNYSPHSMRHSTACHLLETGVEYLVNIMHKIGEKITCTVSIVTYMLKKFRKLLLYKYDKVIINVKKISEGIRVYEIQV